MLNSIKRTAIVITSSMMCLHAAYAEPKYDIGLSTVLKATEPDGARGIQLRGIYDPDRFHWRRFNLLFDGVLGYFTTHDPDHHSTITLLALSPVVRYTFHEESYLKPFIEISIGATWLSHSQFGTRLLGIPFAFQDRAGMGMQIGYDKRFTVGLHAVHYSNAHLSTHNAGMSFPIMLDVSYRLE